MGDYIIKTSKEGMPVPVIDDSDLVDSLIAWEGFLEHPKNIGDGKITLGSGLTDPKWVKLYHQRGDVWSKEDNRRAVAEEVAARREWASKDIPNWDLLNPKSQKALLSYKYNYDFNRENSPKMYKALEGKNWKETTRQMDATSDDPKFKKGLEDRRKREQRWFMSGVHDAETARGAMEKSSFWEKNKDRMMETIGNAVKAGSKTGSWAYGGNMSTSKTWESLSMKEKADIMKVAVQNGITNLADIRDKYEELMGNYSAGAMVDALYENNPTEEYLGEPEHHYDFTQTEEWANAHGYYPDERGHRDDRVKKPTHPTHPSRGSWEGNIFKFTDKGMESPNYTMFGVVDNNQDPQATLVYDNGIVLPEWTVTPQGNYVENPYDNIRLHYAKGGRIYIKPSHRGRFTELKKRTGHSASWFKAHGTPAQRKMATFALNARKWKHALGGPLVDAANAHIYDGTTENSQQMNNDYIFTGAPSQYDFQVTAEAPTVYWDGFNWIGFNDLGQRVTKGSNFNPSGARVIESPQEFENARLAQARRKDVNGTHRFAEDIRNFTTELVLLPAGDVLAEPIGILGGKALSAAAKTKVGKAVLQGIENIASKFTKEKPVTPAEFWAKDISSKTQGDVGDKEAIIEQARQALIDWVKSPYYKERASNEAFYNVADDVIEDAASTIENAPIEIKDRSLILSRANGETSPRPTIETVLPDGTNMFDFDTGLDVSAASDLNEESLYSTILHELEHYMTANSHGITLPRKDVRVIDGGWFSPEEVHFDLIDRIHKNRGKGWQRYIMDQNDALLPKYDSVVKMVMEEPEKAKSLFMQAGKTAEEAQQKVIDMQDYYSYLYDIQEQRAFLQELFHTQIKPNIKNPNNASEIESYLIKHPEILNDFPAFERIQEIRPGNIKQYASYFASALSALPFISKQANNE